MQIITSNIFDLRFLFSNCISLAFIPNISKWNLSEDAKRDHMFQNCLSLSYIPIEEIRNKYYNCINLLN